MCRISNVLECSGKTYTELTALAQDMKEFVIGFFSIGRQTSVIKMAHLQRYLYHFCDS